MNEGNETAGHAPPAGRLLVITELDCRHERNQRVHHQVRYLAPFFCETIVLYRAVGASDVSWWRYLRSIFGVRIASWGEGNVSYVEVDPFWNPPWGCRIRYLGFLGQLLFDPLSLMLGYLLRVRKRFDVVLAVGPQAASVGFILRSLGLARLLVYDDIDYEPGRWRRRVLVRYLAWMERFFMARADLRVTVGEALAEVRRSQGVSEIAVIPNGVDYETFAAAQTKVEHPPSILYTGNIAWHHSGLELAIRATRKIAVSCPEVRLLIVGGGYPQDERELHSHIRGLKVEAWVRVEGQCPYAELARYARQSDVGWAVFPPNATRQYAFPLKVIEYMAAGLVVLGTAGSQTARLIQRYDCGVVTPYDADAVAEAVLSLLGDRRRLAESAQNGARAAAAFDWEDLMAKQRALILSRLQDKATGLSGMRNRSTGS